MRKITLYHEPAPGQLLMATDYQHIPWYHGAVGRRTCEACGTVITRGWLSPQPQGDRVRCDNCVTLKEDHPVP